MNVVILSGRLTSDVELKSTNSGKNYARFGIAVNRTFSKDEVDFINCMVWEKKAEFIAQYFKKGDGIEVTGELRVSSYETDNGEKRKNTEVLISNAEFPKGAKRVESTSSSESTTKSKVSSPAAAVEDDDFPF